MYNETYCFNFIVLHLTTEFSQIQLSVHFPMPFIEEAIISSLYIFEYCVIN